MSTPSRCSRLLIAATIVATTASLSAVASLENGPVAAATSGSFTQLDPVRLLDTRSGDKIGELDGSGTATQLQVTGTNGIPTSGITAIALNVTAVATEANDYGGYVTVYPCGTPPDTSNLNFVSGQTIPNSVIAPVSTTGKVCFYVYGKAHLLADIHLVHRLMNGPLQERTLTQNPTGVTSLGKLIATGIATSSRGEITLSEGTLDMLGLN